MKLVLLWLYSDQQLNSKDIEDFLFFPTGIHATSYDQRFRRYALSKLMNAAGILRWTYWRELTISNIWSDSKWKPQKPWIPNVYTSSSDLRRIFAYLNPIKGAMVKAIGRQRETNFWCKSRNRLSFWRRKKIWFENRTKTTNQRQRGCFATIPDRVACGSWNEELWSYGVPLTEKGHRWGRTSLKSYEGLKDLL
jgi:hypothetical protein